MKVAALLTVNGDKYDLMIEPNRTLQEILREDLDLTGTKECCSTGECGLCTVLIDGKAQLSCLLLAVECEGKEITTIEGLTQDGKLHPLQKEFIENGALQCGFCTPAMVLTSKALLDVNPRPSAREVKEALNQVLCRCTGYDRIVETVMKASEKLGTG